MEHDLLRLAIARLELERRRWLREYFQSLGIPLGQGQPRILDCLLRKGPLSQRQLAQLCGIDDSTLSRSVDRLARAGLVRREADPTCRRSLLLHLTEAGREAAGRVSSAFARQEEVLLRGIERTEARRMTELLALMRENLLREPFREP